MPPVDTADGEDSDDGAAAYDGCECDGYDGCGYDVDGYNVAGHGGGDVDDKWRW